MIQRKLVEPKYLDWIKGFIYFHGKRHPSELGAPEVERFLTHLAVAHNFASATQNQAKSALLFVYREVLGVERRMQTAGERTLPRRSQSDCG